jgi:hypothetical protein
LNSAPVQKIAKSVKYMAESVEMPWGAGAATIAMSLADLAILGADLEPEHPV